MSGLLTALGTGTSGLMANQTAIEVAGHNISNASTDGYTLERVDLQAAVPQDVAVGIVGRGVDVKSIERLTDEFLNSSLRQGASDLKSLDIKQTTLQQVESVFDETSGNGLSAQLTKFFQSLDTLAQSPEDLSVRQSVVNQAQSLATTFQTMSTGLTNIQGNLDGEVGTSVSTVNSLITDIAGLNQKILDSENSAASGSRNANDLRDQRDLDLQKLSELVQVKTFQQSDGQVNVYADGDPLVMQNRANLLTTTTTVTNGVSTTTPVFASNNGPLVLRSGSLEGLVTARDVTIPKYLGDLNTLAASVINEVNKIQSSGIGLNGFSTLTGTNAVTSPTAVLNAAGLPLTPVNGSFTINVTNKNTGDVVSSNVQVDLDGIAPPDTTLNALSAAINGIANLTSSVTTDNKLTISAASSAYTFTFSNDTSHVLAALGLNTLFTGKDASSIGVNSLVSGDLSKLAAATTPNKGDNSNALAMAALRSTPVMNSNTTSLEAFHQGTVGTLAVESAQQKNSFQGQQLRNDQLSNQRQQISGVNVDEEMIKLMQFQRAFQGSARFVTIVNDMLDTLVNKLF